MRGLAEIGGGQVESEAGGGRCRDIAAVGPGKAIGAAAVVLRTGSKLDDVADEAPRTFDNKVGGCAQIANGGSFDERVLCIGPGRDLAQTLLRSPKPERWQSVRLRTRITPDGSTATQAFALREPSGQAVQGWYPADAAIDHLDAQAKQHWALAQQAGQAKWYGMAITVQQDGRFNVDFEYRDDHREGDISRPG